MLGLRRIREARALSQRDLSAKSGVGAATISRLESGLRRAYPVTVRKLAKALSVEPAQLYGEVE